MESTNKFDKVLNGYGNNNNNEDEFIETEMKVCSGVLTVDEDCGSIKLNITKKMYFKSIAIALLIGVAIGVMITSVMASYKIMRIQTESYKEQLSYKKSVQEDYVWVDLELEKTRKELEEITSSSSDMLSENETLKDINKSMQETIDEYSKREELYDKYEYILVSNNNRTDLSYEQVEFAEKEMLDRNINPHLLFGVVKLESNGKMKATNSKSTARGYCQFLKGTGKWVYEDMLKKGTYNHDLAFNGKINLEMGAEYLSYLMKKYNGNVMNTFLEYNGKELGERYYHIVNNTLKKYTNTNLTKIQNEYKNM